jgi:RsiW-degrading membrane proteinase PrsW (M82 family)
VSDEDWRGPGEHTQPFTPEFTGALTAQGLIDPPAPEPVAAPAHTAVPTVVPGVAQYLSRWRFVLVVAGVWIVAAAVGVGLYYWWYQSVDKTMPVFVVLVYLVSCIVGGLLSALVQNRPVLAATAIALMSAPFASTAAAAVLYGGYVFGWIAR